MNKNLLSMDRAVVNQQTLVSPEFVEVCGVKVRHMSLETMGILALLGNPMADLLGGADIGLMDICEFIWVHATPPDELLTVVLGCSPALKAPAQRGALELCRTIPPHQVQEIANFIKAQAMAQAAAAVEVEDDGKKKMSTV